MSNAYCEPIEQQQQTTAAIAVTMVVTIITITNAIFKVSLRCGSDYANFCLIIIKKKTTDA